MRVPVALSQALRWPTLDRLQRGGLALPVTGIAVSVIAALLGYAQKLPCSTGGAWNNYTAQFRDACYTDIYPLYYTEGLSRGVVPYSGHPVQYPVLIGDMMQAAAWVVRPVTDAFARGRDFYYVTVLMLAVCLIAGVLATGYAAERKEAAGRAAGSGAGNSGAGNSGAGNSGAGNSGLSEGVRASLMVALSPGLILAAFINWDLLAMALTAGAMAAWAARREVWAGMLLGLAVAAKFYPLVIFGALFLLCLRAGKMRDFWRALAAGVAAWVAVNLPWALTATAGWGKFYAFSSSRGADWGSVWYFFETYNVPLVGDSSIGRLNLMSSVCVVAAFAAIALFALAAPRRPRLAQLAFLLLAAFLMLNKVWSPQYVIWLVPLAVLARPRLLPYLLWQMAEVAYFFGIWGYFTYLYPAPGESGYAGISAGAYFVILAARLATVALLAGSVVLDIIDGERDVARPAGHEDPGGGVLDGSPDRLVIRWTRVPVAS